MSIRFTVRVFRERLSICVCVCFNPFWFLRVGCELIVLFPEYRLSFTLSLTKQMTLL